MVDSKTIVVSCSGRNQIVGAVNKAKSALPLDIRKKLAAIFSDYLAMYGIDGTFERMNNRSVEQIFAEYQPGNLKIVASGEVDGLKYRLSEAPILPPNGGTDKVTE